MLEYYRFKEIYELFMKGKQDDAKHLLMDLQSSYIQVCDENSTLRSQVQEFEDILYLSKNLIFDGNYYWLITGNFKQGPFCQSCYNSHGLLIRLNDIDDQRKCYHCGSQFQPEEQKIVPKKEDTVARALHPAKVIPLYK